jgi:hypothetical protein
MLEASSKKSRKASDRHPIEEEVWHHSGYPQFNHVLVKCYDLTVTVPSIEEGQAKHSWVPRPSMADKSNVYLWASLALYGAFRVIGEYDTYFAIAPYNTEYRTPSEIPGC